MTNEATRRGRRQIVGEPIRRLLAARVLSRDVSHVEQPGIGSASVPSAGARSRSVCKNDTDLGLKPDDIA
jgi:hypothetical protein